MYIRHNTDLAYKMLLYDLLYFTADLLIKIYNPCKIHHEKEDLSLTEGLICRLSSQPDKVTCISGKPCCTSCEYLDDNGCTVKCLGCKLGLCLTATKKHPKLERSLIKMKGIAMKQGWCMVWIRTSRERVHQHLKRTRQ